MRCTTSTTLPSVLALSLFALACSEDRVPSGPSTVVRKDATTATGEDGGVANMDGTTNPGMDASTTNDDATTNPNMDATSPGNPDAMTGCACDMNPNACDQGCACDTRCMTTPDAGPATPFDGGTLTGDPFNPSTLANSYATAYCNYRSTCQPVFTTYLPQTTAECVTETSAALAANWNAYQPLIAAGRMAFSQTGFNTCIQSFTAAQSACAVGPDPAACENIFTGNRPEDAPCSASTECGDGLWCNLTAIGGCGVCTAFAQAGEDCSAALCANGTDCFDVGGAPTCVPVDAPLNSPCGDVTNGLCRGELQCVGPANALGTCTLPAARGAACDPAQEMNADCNIYQNDVCGMAGTCVALTLGTTGSPCDTAGPTTLCNADNRCDAATTACVALPGAGGMCNDDVPCLDGFACIPAGAGSPQGTCNTITPAGAMCSGDVQCGDNYCVSGSCTALFFNAACN